MTVAADRAALDRMIPLALAEHVAWLREHGEDAPAPGPWRVDEEIDATRDASMDILFAAERDGVGDAELERWIARAGFARAGLLAAFDALPGELRDFAPPAESMAHVDPWARDPRTARDIITHVLRLEVYYRDALRDGAARGIFEDVADPATERAQTIDILRSVPRSGRARTFAPVRPRATAPERWTLRKVVRRIISHERAHAAELVERRTWAYLGVPAHAPRA